MSRKLKLIVLLLTTVIVYYSYEIVPLFKEEQRLLSLSVNKPKTISVRTKHKIMQDDEPPSFIKKIYSFSFVKFVYKNKQNQITVEMSLSDYDRAKELLNLIMGSSQPGSLEIDVTSKNSFVIRFKYKKHDGQFPPVILQNLLSICDGTKYSAVKSKFPVSLASLVGVTEVSGKRSAWLLWPNGVTQVVNKGDRLTVGGGQVTQVLAGQVCIRQQQQDFVLYLDR